MNNWEKIQASMDKLEKKEKDKKEDSLDNTFNNIVSKIVNNVDPSDIQIKDPTDFKSMFDIYNKAKENATNNNGGGKLPPLSTGLENIIEQSVHVSYQPIQKEDGTVEQEKLISAKDIAAMDNDTIKSLLDKKDKIQNADNARRI